MCEKTDALRRNARGIIAGGLALVTGFGVYWYGTGSIPAVQADGPKPTATAQVGKTESPMFGGNIARNMVNLVDKEIGFDFSAEEGFLWKAQLGSRAYGGPTIGSGKAFVGTNNENPRNKRDRGKATEDDPLGPPIDRGIYMCFDLADGKFVWQAVHDKLASGPVHDWPREGVCSTALVEGDRLYYVTNRCTLICVDVNGFTDGKNDGVQTEKYKDPTDADVIWELDMMKELKVQPHNMSASSPMAIGDLLYLVTGNGVDEGHINIPSPDAPSFICVNKTTGKLVWQSSLPGRAIMHGQWANPSYGEFGGRPTVLFPGGDGWLYGFEPKTGKLLWKFDGNPKDSKYELGGKGTRSDFINCATVHQNRIYIGTGQDPEHSEGIGHFWCIDPSNKEGDISPDLVTDDKVDPPLTKPNPNSGVVWHYGGEEKRKFAKRDYVFGRTMSTACVVDDLIYIPELAGYIHCLDMKTGKKLWQFDMKSNIWGSAYYCDGKVFVGNEDGDLFVFKHLTGQEAMDEVEIASKEADEKTAGKKLIEVRKAVAQKYLLKKIELQPIRSTPVVAGGVLYVMTENTLFAFGHKK